MNFATMNENELASVIGGKRYKVYLGNTLVGTTNSFSGVAGLKRKAQDMQRFIGGTITVR